MYLEKLDLRGIRNLQPIQLSLNPQINIFYGANGSGKTSLLEAVYLLGRGRSFRTRNPLSVISRDADELLVVGFVRRSEENSLMPVGMQRKRSGGLVLKVGGETVNASSALADNLPLLLLNADTFLLLEGGPKGRRHYLDWGVFHVEQGYRNLWLRFQRALKQRNSLLRHDRMDEQLLTTWDQEFVALAEQLSSFRQRYTDKLLPAIGQMLQALAQEQMPEVKLRYYPGWDTARSLSEVLLADRKRDLQFGTTHHGPHKADLKASIGRVPAGDLLSRGQAKVLVSAMQLAQGRLFQEETGKRCLYLLDDLPSELDKEHRNKVSRLLSELGSQVFVTGVDRDDLLQAWPEYVTESCGLFHVEHGQISPEKLS